MENIDIYRAAGAACDRYIASRLAATLSTDYEMVEGVPGATAIIGDSLCHIKTAESVPGCILFEHTGNNGRAGWMHGPSEVGYQVSGASRVYAWDMVDAAEYVLKVYGEPGDGVEPLPQPECKVPERWLSRLGRSGDPVGDLFIFVHSHELRNAGIGTWIPVPALDSVVRLCKNARNTHQPLETRLAALARLEELSA